MMYSGLLLAMAVSVADVASSARAPNALAVVAVDGCSQTRSARSAKSLRSVLAVTPQVTVLSEPEMVGLLGGAQRGSLRDVERLLTSARLYFQEEISSKGPAEKALREAMEILMSLPPSEPYRWQMVKEVGSFQAQIYSIDRVPEAERTLGRILRVEPDFQVDQERYSPAMWKLTDTVRERVRAQRTATLRVTSVPAGIPVAVEGKMVGGTPVVLKVPPGEYRVEGVFGSERHMARTVRVESEAEVELEEDLDGSVDLASGPCLALGRKGDDRFAGVAKLSRFLGVERAVGVWQVEQPNGEAYLHAAVVNATSGRGLREARVKIVGGQPPAGAIEKLAGFLVKGAVQPPVETVSNTLGGADLFAKASPVQVVARPADTSSSRRTWGLAVGGAGLAAAAAGTVFQLMAYQDEKTASTASSLAQYDAAKSSASSRRTTAAILWGAGAVGVGVGTYLFLTGHPSSTSVTVVPLEGSGAVAVLSGSIP